MTLQIKSSTRYLIMPTFLQVLIASTFFIPFSLFVSIAQTETYTWEDKDGVHFTDSYDSIPKKIKDKGTYIKRADPPKSRQSSATNTQTKNKQTYEDFDSCVANEQINFKLRKRLLPAQASREAILLCSDIFGINPNTYYGNATGTIDSTIENRDMR